MRKKTDSKEIYLLLSQISKSTTIPKSTIYDNAVKLKTRLFKIRGRLWLEIKDAECVLCSLRSRRTNAEQIAIDTYLDAVVGLDRKRCET